ncbi:MAG TPA: DUF5663 domain-containing protein [Candidatus Saccharimonadales bacterium]|nr:DUF5663 domain-containing protein [Candidatus Saccharimonadales bacterium]
MIKLDDDLLAELGLATLPPEEKKKLLAHIYETLEMRVGMKLAEQMTDAQLNEFEQFINANDESGALHWLETKFPHYKDVVASEFENLKREIGQVAPQILAAATAQAQQSMAGQPQMPGQPAAQMPPAAPQAPPAPAPEPYSPSQYASGPTQPPSPMWPGDQTSGQPDPWQGQPNRPQ